MQPKLTGWRKLGFELVLISMDNVDELAAYVTDRKLDVTVLMDSKRQVSPKLYGVTGYPTTVFVDRQGIVRRISVGWSPTALDKFTNAVVDLTK